MIVDAPKQIQSHEKQSSMRNIILISFAAFIWSFYLSIQGQFLQTGYQFAFVIGDVFVCLSVPFILKAKIKEPVLLEKESSAIN